MRDHLRQPLFWIVVAEVAVMFALFVVSWRVYQASRPAPVAVAALPAPRATVEPSPSAKARIAVATPKPKLPPRPAASPSAFPVDLAKVNSQQASLERAEESILARVLDAMRAYLERVVLPAVRRAESATAATSAAAAQSPAAMRKMP